MSRRLDLSCSPFRCLPACLAGAARSLPARHPPPPALRRLHLRRQRHRLRAGGDGQPDGGQRSLFAGGGAGGAGGWGGRQPSTAACTPLHAGHNANVNNTPLLLLLPLLPPLLPLPLLQVQEASAASEGFWRMPDAWINLANVYLAQEQYAAAIQMYRSALRKFYDNRNPNIMLYLARCGGRGRRAEARGGGAVASGCTPQLICSCTAGCTPPLLLLSHAADCRVP